MRRQNNLESSVEVLLDDNERLFMNDSEALVYFKHANVTELADEALAYSAADEINSKQYIDLCDEIMLKSKSLPEILRGKSVNVIVKKCSSNGAKQYIDFYDRVEGHLNGQKKDSLSKIKNSLLIEDIVKSFNYILPEKCIYGFSRKAYLGGKHLKEMFE